MVALALTASCKDKQRAAVAREDAGTVATARVDPLDAANGAPVVASFVRFENRDGEWKGGDAVPVGAKSKKQGLVFEMRNLGDRTVGRIDYELRYADANGAAVTIATRHGPKDHDEVGNDGLDPTVAPSLEDHVTAIVIAPGQTREVWIQPVNGPIPAAAATAELRVTKACEIRKDPPNAIGLGPCFWP